LCGWGTFCSSAIKDLWPHCTPFLSLCLPATLAHCFCRGRAAVLVVGAWRLSIYFPQAVARQCFLLSASKIFSQPQKNKGGKKLGSRQEKAVDREQIRPAACPSAVLGHPSTFACSLRCQPTSSIFFLSICPRRIVFAFNCGIKNTPEYVVLRLVLAVSLFMAPVRLCRQSISFLVLASAFWSVFARSPLTLCGRGRVNGYSIYLPHSRKQALEAMKMI